MQNCQRRQDIGDVVAARFLQQGNGVPQPRLEALEPSLVEIETGTCAAHLSEQMPVGDGEGIGLSRVEESHRPLRVAQLLHRHDRLAPQHHSPNPTRPTGLGDEPVHPSIERGTLPDPVPGHEQPMDETQAELRLLGGEGVFGGDGVKRVVLTDLRVKPRRRQRVPFDDGQLLDAADEQPIEQPPLRSSSASASWATARTVSSRR